MQRPEKVHESCGAGGGAERPQISTLKREEAPALMALEVVVGAWDLHVEGAAKLREKAGAPLLGGSCQPASRQILE